MSNVLRSSSSGSSAPVQKDVHHICDCNLRPTEANYFPPARAPANALERSQTNQKALHGQHVCQNTASAASVEAPAPATSTMQSF